MPKWAGLRKRFRPDETDSTVPANPGFEPHLQWRETANCGRLCGVLPLNGPACSLRISSSSRLKSRWGIM